MGDVLRAIIDLISRHGDEIGLQRFHRADNPLQIAPRCMRSDVQVRELRDSRAVELRRKIGQRCLELVDDQSSRADVSDEERRVAEGRQEAPRVRHGDDEEGHEERSPPAVADAI